MSLSWGMVIVMRFPSLITSGCGVDSPFYFVYGNEKLWRLMELGCLWNALEVIGLHKTGNPPMWLMFKECG